ncbi:MAG: alpha-amylase family glycosyl hydrolase [Polyangiaceae bacterium]
MKKVSVRNFVSGSRLRGLSWLGAAALVSVCNTGCMDFEGLEGEREISTHVEDWRDEVIYQLMVDRFANGDRGNDYRVDLSAPARYHGGDWRGIEENLDYLSDLGVTALWISPIVKNVETDAGVDGYHGYWQQDLTMLNPHFGDLASLRRMVDAAHARGIKVILDIVTNHMGQLFYYDINLNGQADERVEGNGTTSQVKAINEYDPDFDPRGIQAFTSLGEAGPAPIIFQRDAATNHMPPSQSVLRSAWAYNRRGRVWSYDITEQVEKGDFPGGLKDLNTLDPRVQEVLIDSFVRWVELADFDGFRIDTLKHVEHEFWQVFAPEVRRRLAERGKTNFFMFGEAFDGRSDVVGPYTLPGEVDSVFFFPQHFQVFRDVFQSGAATTQVAHLFQTRDESGLYGTQPQERGIGVAPNRALVNFIDNHDVARFKYGRDDDSALENALLFLFTEDGIPCVYYGTEQGFRGGNDPANREDLWSSGYDTNYRTYRWISRLSKLRRNYPALTRGELNFTWVTDRVADESDAGILAFERRGGDAGDGYALVVINTNAAHTSRTEFEGAAMPLNVASGTVLVDVLDPSGPSYTVAADGTLALDVPATSGKILIPQAQVKAGL